MNQATHPEEHLSQHRLSPREFAMCFTSTPRGARLARRLVAHRLAEWGHPYDSDANETITLIAAELAANAVRHGHVPGRDFHLRLTATSRLLRVEVADTRGERTPDPHVPSPPPCDAESGRGLLLVARLAARWGVAPREAAPGKCVWAEFDLPRRGMAGTCE
ncbi:ATP-binding protein [Streptomyces sp. NPDC006356]